MSGLVHADDAAGALCMRVPTAEITFFSRRSRTLRCARFCSLVWLCDDRNLPIRGCCMLQVPGREPLLRVLEETLERHATAAAAHAGRRPPWWKPLADAGHDGALDKYNAFKSRRQPNFGLLVFARNMFAHAEPTVRPTFELCIREFPWMYRAVLAFQRKHLRDALQAAPVPPPRDTPDAGGGGGIRR